jgi:hypothetical protein
MQTDHRILMKPGMHCTVYLNRYQWSEIYIQVTAKSNVTIFFTRGGISIQISSSHISISQCQVLTPDHLPARLMHTTEFR